MSYKYTKICMLLILSMVLLLVTGCGGDASSTEPAAEPVSEVQPAESEESMDEHDEHEEGDEHDDHDEEGEHDHDHDAEAVMLSLPELTAVELDGRPLRVVATTNIIGDVVANIGGDAIELTTLMGPGVDPHSYEATATDFAAVADADVIFVNGWNLEEGLVEDLETAAEGALIVVISAGIEPLEFGEDGHGHDDEHDDEQEEGEHSEHDHGGADPHVWFSVHNVEQWAINAEAVLHELDPANHDSYEANLESYLEELEALDDYVHEQIETIPAENRKLVTNHDSFGYFADEHDFEVIGTIIPAASTTAEPSASDLAELIEEMNEESVCTIFTENTVSTQLADTVAAELATCDSVQVLPLLTGSLGPVGAPTDSYIGFTRTNIDTIVNGLSQ